MRKRTRSRHADTPLFRPLSAKQLADVDRVVTTLDVHAGKQLMRQGQSGREFIVIADGHAEVQHDGQVIAVRGPGTFIGETSLLLDRPRNASVVARTDMTIDVIDRQGFRWLLQRYPRLHAPLLAATAQRLAEIDHSV